MHDEEVPLPPNILRRIGTPRQSAHECEFTTETVAEAAAAIRAVAPQYEIAIWLAACAGLRMGEVLGMTWGNVDMNRNRLSVTQQLFKREIRPLKTQSSRATLPIDPFLTDKLRAHKHAFPPVVGHEDKVAGSDSPSPGWIMVNANNAPLTGANFLHRWTKARSLSNLPPKIPFHSLRHYYISMLAASGRYSLTTIQFLARHGCIESTLKYISPIDDPEGKGVSTFTAAFTQQN
ncbi:site-specific integrase [Streptomyces sp. NBC_01515]|uniref:site-specific integrase n=1 Tax=Streptomyces sp. NBC_01515 TaxID=2903890 RepID=UPI0038693D08